MSAPTEIWRDLPERTVDAERVRLALQFLHEAQQGHATVVRIEAIRAVLMSRPTLPRPRR